MSEHLPLRPIWKRGDCRCKHAVERVTKVRIESLAGLEIERTFMCRCGAFVVTVEQVVLLGAGR